MECEEGGCEEGPEGGWSVRWEGVKRVQREGGV